MNKSATSRPQKHAVRSTDAQNPGFLFRRLQQLSSSNFMNALRAHQITPIQYTILRVLSEHPSIDQRTVATHAALDTSTTTDVLRRLTARKLISRIANPTDKRARVVRLTRAGEQLLLTVRPLVFEARQELLSPLSPNRQKLLIGAIQELLAAHAGTEGAPADNGPIDGSGPWKRFR